MTSKANYLIPALAIAVLLVSATAVQADVTSPHYEDRDTTYSKEVPNSAYFGTGIAGRMNEASMLRFEAEQLLMERKFDEAVRKSSKALQLDPGDPSTHLLYAHALTGKFYKAKGPIDEQLLNECIAEWKLIWRHSTDCTEQIEARQQCKVLVKVARELARLKEQKAEMAAAKAKLAEKNPNKEEPSKPDQKTESDKPAATLAGNPAADSTK